MFVADSTDSRIHNSATNGGISGIVMTDSQRLQIDHNSVTDTSGWAIPVVGSSHNRFDHNVLNSDRHGLLLAAADPKAGSNDNEVTHNRLSDGPGLEVDQSSDNIVRDNMLNNPGDGILLSAAPRTQVRHNTITQAGIGFDTFGLGIALDGTDDSALVDNTVSGSKLVGILIGSFDFGPSDRNLVSGNRAYGNLVDGVVVNNGVTNNRLEGNIADRNGQDGIHVDAAGTTATRNTANDNGNYGIEAAFGVIDGGGNKASGNGNPLQCLNVLCK